jgi:Ser-tRNA(Ala) deacylase AlaX
VREFTAEVVDIREESRSGTRQRWQMLLDHTAFSATASTGTLEAVARSGALLEVPVSGVFLEGEVVWHLVGKPLAAGTAVTGRVADDVINEG